MNALRTFYENESQREAVKDFLLASLNELAIERVMSKKNTEGIADAKEIIERSFITLKELYGEAPKVSHQSSR